MCVDSWFETINLILLEIKIDADMEINSCWCVLLSCILFHGFFSPSGRCMELVHISLVFTFEVPLPESMVDCEHLAMILNRLQPARPQRERESPEAACACLSAASFL